MGNGDLENHQKPLFRICKKYLTSDDIETYALATTDTRPRIIDIWRGPACKGRRATAPTPLLAGEQMAMLDIPVMLGTAVLCLPLFFTGAVLSRVEGVLFLVLYVAYVWVLIAMALALGYLPALGNAVLYGLVPVILIFVVGSLVRDRRRYHHG